METKMQHGRARFLEGKLNRIQTPENENWNQLSDIKTNAKLEVSHEHNYIHPNSLQYQWTTNSERNTKTN